MAPTNVETQFCSRTVKVTRSDVSKNFHATVSSEQWCFSTTLNCNRDCLTSVGRISRKVASALEDELSAHSSHCRPLHLSLAPNLQCFSFLSLISCSRNLTPQGSAQIPLLPWSLLWSPHLEMIELSFEHHCPLYFSAGTSPIPPYIGTVILPQLPC